MIKSRKIQTVTGVWLLLVSFCSMALSGSAQDTLTLEACYNLAGQHYPLSKKRQLIRRTERYTLDAIANNRLPQLHLNGHATYQSDVTRLPIALPGMEIETMRKDQYKVYGEVLQPLYDGGLVHEQRALEKSKSAIDEAQLEVDLYQLKARINQLFFGVLLVDEKLKQTALVQEDINKSIQSVRTALANGLALQSDLSNLQAEQLQIVQRMIEYRANRQVYLDLLGAYTGRHLPENTQLKKPLLQLPDQDINRPELAVFHHQRQTLQIRDRLINVGNRPKINLFVQGGYGRPALNMLDNDFSTYYVGGIRLSWSLTGLYTSKENRALLQLSDHIIDVRQETFLFNTALSMTRQTAEMEKLQQLLKVDEKIITLRTEISHAAASRLHNGAITANDYLKEVNAEDQARQQQLLHEIQLLMAYYDHKITAGN